MLRLTLIFVFTGVSVWILNGIISGFHTIQTGTPKQAVQPWKPNIQTNLPDITVALRSDTSEIINRSLFSPTRKLEIRRKAIESSPSPSQPKTVVPAAPEEPEPVDIHLAGILLQNKLEMALLRSPARGIERWVPKFSDFLGWKLVEIKSGEVFLESSGKRISAPLYNQENQR